MKDSVEKLGDMIKEEIDSVIRDERDKDKTELEILKILFEKYHNTLDFKMDGLNVLYAENFDDKVDYLGGNLDTCTFDYFVELDKEMGDDILMLGCFKTLDELQDLLSNYTEYDVDVEWNNPYFDNIHDLIKWSEIQYKGLIG